MHGIPKKGGVRVKCLATAFEDDAPGLARETAPTIHATDDLTLHGVNEVPPTINARTQVYPRASRG